MNPYKSIGLGSWPEGTTVWAESWTYTSYIRAILPSLALDNVLVEDSPHNTRKCHIKGHEADPTGVKCFMNHEHLKK